MSAPAPPSRARRLLRLVAALVPRRERRAFLEEWESELTVLEGVEEQGRRGYPHPLRFVVGALPHALWMRMEGWTMRSVLQDLGQALRVLARSPGFALVTTVTLALGLGANATIFSLLDGLLLRAPPGLHEPDRLVQIARSYDGAPRWDNWSWPAYRALRAESRVFEGVAGYGSLPLTIGSGADAEQVPAILVSADYFEVLGVRPAIGRLLGPGDEVDVGGHPVLVLGHELWQRRFGGDPSVIGRTVQAGGRGYEVVGVAPPAFRGAETLGSTPQAFVPAFMHPPFLDMLPFGEWGWSWLHVVGRLAPGVTLEEARAATDVVTLRLREADPANEDVRVLLAGGVGLSPEDRAEGTRLGMLLLGIAVLVLLLTCASVANLFLARASARTSELGIRLALGAGRGRLARQLVTESLLLGVLAAALAVVPLVLGARALPALIPYPVNVPLAPDTRVLLSLLGLGLLAALVFGAGPSLAATRRALAAGSRASGTRVVAGSSRARDALVVAQLTLSLGLLAGTALLGTSVLEASRADPGFRPRGVLAAAMDLGGTGRYDRVQAAAFGERLAREAAALPGVAAAAVASQAPFLAGTARSSRAPAERPEDPAATVEAQAIFVSEGYFETLGIPLLRGRTLGPAAAEPEPVAVVNEALARRLWPDGEALGAYLAGEPEIRVVGVVADVRDRSLRAEAAPAAYQPLPESFTQRLQLLVRAEGGDPLRLSGPVRVLVASLDPGVPVLATEDLHERMAASLGATRPLGVLVAIAAGVALLLSVVALYGLVTFGVSRRVREMGVRVALGAMPSGLVRLVLRRVLALTALGVLAGILLAVALGRAIEGLLYGVEPVEPGALLAATLLLLGASLLAGWLPARRVARLDPVEALRTEG